MAPRVSIGLPVYNGERFIEQAIESVLAQSFTDFELTISDNASTDATAEIAGHYAASDPRVRHLRHPETHGARWNFNTVFAESRGSLFAWLAHDDMWAPDFLERCVAAFDADDDIVLAFSHVSYVNERSEVVGSREMAMRVGSEAVHERLWDLLMVWHDCLPVFGLIRTEVLRHTGLIGPYASGDHLLLAELGLAGRFAIVDDHLFSSRIHPGQSIRTFDVWVDHHAYAEWFEATQPGRLSFPQWRLSRDLLLAVARAPVGVVERLRCLPAVVRWAIRYRTLLWKDLVFGARRWWRYRRDGSTKPRAVGS